MIGLFIWRRTKSFSTWIGVVLGLVSVTEANAQLFPGLEGENLVHAIQDNFTPGQLLTETQVKDTLYAKVFIQGDSLHCIYSDLAHDLPPGVDPSQWIYENGTEVNSMNLEHGWPQAKGAGEGKPGNRNMHHLFPSRSAINSDRGDLPFGEIADNTTQKWYHREIETSMKPATNLDAYSEFKTGVFEPREAVKGDIARAMFYFWTIYRDDAVQADPLFFDLMKDNLCLWHEEDPADSFEVLRTQRIASYQDGKVNPFILDCSLTRRAYCPNLQECMIVASTSVTRTNEKILFDVGQHIFVITAEDGLEWSVVWVDITGRTLFSSSVESNQKEWMPDLIPGIYFIVAMAGDHTLFGRQVFLAP